MSTPEDHFIRLARAHKSTVHCSGKQVVDEQFGTLYYDTVDSLAKKINIFNATAEQLDEFAAACQPAEFGRGLESVFDETYRKAGKMDTTNFASRFDVHDTDILPMIQSELVVGIQENISIRPELYKLNVYGKGGFFKAHRDTPRARSMFGSLVVAFGCPHTGGSLLLRHKEHEWKFKSDELVGTGDNTEPYIAFVAFFSDVEHEVETVESGHRITLTYNLYLNQHRPRQPIMYKKIQPSDNQNQYLKTALQELLAYTKFMPDGGCLGFGLEHQYPFAQSDLRLPIGPKIKARKGKKKQDNEVEEVTNWRRLDGVMKYLKGRDAALYRVCEELGLEVSLGFVFGDEGDGLCRLDVFPCFYLDHGESIWDQIGEYKPIELDDETVTWVTKVNKHNRVVDAVATYGNGPAEVGIVYADICMFVEIKDLEGRGIIE